MDKSLSLIKITIVISECVRDMKDCNEEVLTQGIVDHLHF